MMHETGQAAVIHPTSTGKSFIAFYLAIEPPDKRICWFSPREYILRSGPIDKMPEEVNAQAEQSKEMKAQKTMIVDSIRETV